MYLGPGSFADRRLSWLLNPLSLPFKLISTINWLQRRVRSRDFPGAFIISVDNLAFGGTGKTSLVMEICSGLQAAGLRFAIISRGYGGSLVAEGVLVNSEHSYSQVGDEALLFKRLFPEQDVFIGRNREKSIVKALAAGNRFIVLDDGLQRAEIIKDLSLLLIDPKHPYYYLRHFRRLGRHCDLVLLHDPDDLNPEKPGYRFERTEIRRVNGQSFDPSGLPLVAFAALGDGVRFLRSISDLNVKRFVAFRDHHPYEAADLTRLDKARRNAGAEFLLCTEKDLVKLLPLLSPDAPFLYVKNKIKLNFSIMKRIMADARAKGILASPD